MNRLHIDEITSIGAVESGDDPEATILLYKSKETIEPAQGLLEKKEGSMSGFDVESLTDEGKEFVAGLQATIAAFSEEPAALPDDLPDIVKSRLDENDATIAKMQAEKDQVSTDLGNLRDEMATDKYDERAKALAVLLGEPDEVAPVLKALAADSPEAFGKLDAMFDTLVVKDVMAPLFKELGSSAVEGSAADQIAAHVTEIRKADPSISVAKAKAQAWHDHPELKTLSREEA